MKTRVATALSVIGVLTAGTAAAMVNTQVFQSDPSIADESSAMLAPQPTPVDLSLGSTSSTMALASTEAGALTEYTIGDAGVVTLDVVDGELRIVSASAFDGWTIIEQEEKPDEDRVEVDFASGSTVVEFDADYVNGQIVPEIEANQTTGASTTPSTSNSSSATTPTTSANGVVSAPSTTVYDDDHDEYEDDDHDEYEDDDHDDDEYEERDEDDDDD